MSSFQRDANELSMSWSRIATQSFLPTDLPPPFHTHHVEQEIESVADASSFDSNSTTVTEEVEESKKAAQTFATITGFAVIDLGFDIPAFDGKRSHTRAALLVRAPHVRHPMSQVPDEPFGRAVSEITRY